MAQCPCHSDARLVDWRPWTSGRGRRGQRRSKIRCGPPPEHERLLEQTLGLCRRLSTCALEQRRIWWRRGPGQAACPEYTTVHSQVLQDVLARLDTTAPACFRRLANGEPAGFPGSRAAPALTPSPPSSLALGP